jgi:hypothetical protein
MSSTLFIGMYRDSDVKRLFNHKGPKYKVWTSNDCNPDCKKRTVNMEKIKKLGIKKHLKDQMFL